jgi:hypothetical protein
MGPYLIRKIFAQAAPFAGEYPLAPLARALATLDLFSTLTGAKTGRFIFTASVTA